MTHTVLFLCTGNSARSILAESILNRLGAGRFTAYSAGSMPTGSVNPHATRLLERFNYPTAHLRSKSWEEFDRAHNPAAPELNFVFTVCDNAAGEVCPIWPGQPMTAHWGVPDPAAAEGTDAEIKHLDGPRWTGDGYYESTFLDPEGNRLEIFVNLPMASLDRLTLQARLDSIGKA